ncbi:MAG: N-6 DNA methylase [Planctomycetes bacterium]|nr:N-6 DNA methylase [Planctomycetota bacterium]
MTPAPVGAGATGGFSLSPAVVRLLCRAAAARCLRRGRPDAIMAGLEELGRDLGLGALPLAAVMGVTDGPELAADPRVIGDAFWRAAFAEKETRRLTGSFYTPVGVIDRILDLIWPDLFPPGWTPGGRARVCDPAMGCGYFLLRLVQRLLADHPDDSDAIRRWVRRNLFGVDRDPVSVFMARALLWIVLSEPGREFKPEPAHFPCGDALLGGGFADASANAEDPAEAIHWPVSFPSVAAAGGFHAVIGNPPYEVLTNFGRHPDRAVLARRLRDSGRYRHSITGQINLYRLFVERGLDLLRDGGLLSMVVPLSLARDAAAVSLRRRLVEREAAADWLLFGERDRLFAGVTQSACIFRAVKGGGRAAAVRVRSGEAESVWSPEELAAFGGDNWRLPLLTAGEARLWRWLMRHPFGRLADLADLRVGEVDQTVYRDCMRDDDTSCRLVRGVHLAPFRLDTERGDGGRRFLDLDRFLRAKGAAAAGCRERAERWRVGQLGIRNLHARPRLVAALLPPGVYAGNSLNVYLPHPGVPAEYLAGLLNSRLLDWLFRVGSGNNNVNLVEMRGLPIPAARPSDPEAEAVAIAYRQCVAVADDPPALATARRQLDAAVESCYRLPEEFTELLP